ncbi:MAG: hypothetical protein KJ747_02715 [Actinobacteria bacterium]|nr:hypothetical protein [Actinomycetota bacterium]MCG2806923.1 hypothetical protein [Coriobacteriia bacterium]
MRRTQVPLFFALGAIVLATLLGCGTQEPREQARTKTPATTSAVYFAPASGKSLTDADLDSHPSVVVARDQASLESLVTTRVAIWIDKGVVSSVDVSWLRERADRERCPVAVIGYNDALYSFRETLPIVGIHGPWVDWDQKQLEPGFSVWMLNKGNTTGSRSGYLSGFSETPTVDAVLRVTDTLLRDERPQR